MLEFGEFVQSCDGTYDVSKNLLQVDQQTHIQQAGASFSIFMCYGDEHYPTRQSLLQAYTAEFNRGLPLALQGPQNIHI